MLKQIEEFFLSLFSKCFICQKNSRETVCKECYLLFQRKSGCFKCVQNCFCDFKTCIPFVYNEQIANMILNFKYNNETYLAKFFAEEIYKVIEDKNLNYVLVPIPISKMRLLERGYNQSFLIAVELKKLLKASIEYDVLKKTKYTVQKGKNNKARKENANNSIFIGDISGIINRNIIIVDDVVSSGATIERSIEILRPFVNSISIAAIAKT